MSDATEYLQSFDLQKIGIKTHAAFNKEDLSGAFALMSYLNSERFIVACPHQERTL